MEIINQYKAIVFEIQAHDSGSSKIEDSTSEESKIGVKTDKVGEPLLHRPLPLPMLNIYLVDDMAHRVGHSPKPFGGLKLHGEGHPRQEYVDGLALKHL